MWEDEARIPPSSYRSAPQRRAAETRRMMMAAGGVGAALLLCVVGYVAATGRGPDAAPVIQAPSGAVKVKPDNPGGLQLNTQTSALLGEGGSAAGADLAPGPEVPDPEALAAAANQEQAPQASTTALTPSTASASQAATSQAAPRPPLASVAAAPTIPAPTAPETPAQPSPQKAAMNIPPPSAAVAAHNLAQEYDPPSPSAGHGDVRVQLAALESEAAALHEWERLTHHMPTLFDGRRPIFIEAHVNGRTFWRVRTAGFASVAEATRFCSDVRGRGAACTVALF